MKPCFEPFVFLCSIWGQVFAHINNICFWGGGGYTFALMPATQCVLPLSAGCLAFGCATTECNLALSGYHPKWSGHSHVRRGASKKL